MKSECIFGQNIFYQVEKLGLTSCHLPVSIYKTISGNSLACLSQYLHSKLLSSNNESSWYRTQKHNVQKKKILNYE